jgi:clan AA aspartic protease (TIGR02281 family)
MSVFVSGILLGWLAEPWWSTLLAPTGASGSRDSAGGSVRRQPVVMPPPGSGSADQGRPAQTPSSRYSSTGEPRDTLALAARLIGAHRFADAEQLLRRYLQDAYRDVEAHRLLAEVFAGRSDYRAAIDQLYEAKGYAYRLDALERLDTRIRALVAERTAALNRLQDQAGLLQLYEQLTRLEPSYANWYLGLARAQLAALDTAGARQSLQLVAQDPEVGGRARAMLADLDRSDDEAPPPAGFVAPQATAGVPLRRRGDHFLVDAQINDSFIARLLIDTGASMTVLSEAALARSGLAYADTGTTRMFSTANGMVRAPVYRLDSLAVGDWQVTPIEIGVLELDGSGSLDGLLGMNFLRHFHFVIDQQSASLRLTQEQR